MATVYSCPSLRSELVHVIPADVVIEFLDFTHHLSPHSLTPVLQRRIDGCVGTGPVILGYGMCSRAVVGLRAGRQQLIVPRVHDCIALLLGSRQGYQQRFLTDPRVLYLSRGWIDCGAEPLADRDRYRERHGIDPPADAIAAIYSHYRRVCLIRTLDDELGRLRSRAQAVAEYLGLDYEETTGCLDYLARLLSGPWSEDDFIVAGPGEMIEQDQFLGIGGSLRCC